MKRFIVFLGVLVLGSESDARRKEFGTECQDLSEKARTLIRQFKELRERRRQLPEGTYDKDLRNHGGKLHRVLSALGDELGHPPYTKQIIVECVGEPDAIKNGRQMIPYLAIYNREARKTGREIKEKKDREYLVYYWRGGHDFMFFIDESGRIVDHGWWFAYE